MITRETILELNKIAGDVSISIFMPTNKSEPEAGGDVIRFKNILKSVRSELEEKNVSKDKIEDLLREPETLLDKPEFWRYNDNGLAMFITDDLFEYYRLPFNPGERHLIDDHFLVTPLVRMLTLEGTYCVLAVSQRKMRLLKCSSESVEQIELEEAPVSMEEFRKFDVYQSTLQQHTGENAGGAIFHGHGGGDDNRKVIEGYLKTVENEITSILRKRKDPLILAGVDSAVSHYRKINHYHRLMDDAIVTNPDNLDDRELKDKGWELIKSYFLKNMYDDLERLGNSSEGDKFSSDLTEIIEGAYFGKVDTLFIPSGESRWGSYEADDTSFKMIEPSNGHAKRDLLNAAAIYTLKNGGNVYSLKEESIPVNTEVAAIFRYA